MRSQSLQQRLLLWYWTLVFAPLVVDTATRVFDVADPAGNVPDLFTTLLDLIWSTAVFLSIGTLISSLVLWRSLRRVFAHATTTTWLVPLVLLGATVLLNLLYLLGSIPAPLSVFD